MSLYYDEKKVISELEKLVNISSYTQDKTGVDNIGLLIRQLLKDVPLNWSVVKDDKLGNLLIAKSKKSSAKLPRILISGHMDTVHKIDKFNKFNLSDNIASGSGISDMKSGIITILWLIRNLQKNNSLSNITVTFIPDEEVGSITHKNYLHRLYKHQDYALVFESNHPKFASLKRINIVTHRKGIAIYKLNCTGIPSHSGVNDVKNKRHSAILELSKKIVELEKLADYKLGTTLNPGIINGGTTVNTIAKNAYVEFDVRYKTMEEMHRIEKSLTILSKTAFDKKVKTKLSCKVKVPPMVPNNKTKIFEKIVKDTIKDMDLVPVVEKRGGGSDGNQISQFGVSTLDGFGPISRGGHTDLEEVLIPAIHKSVEISYNTVLKLQK